MRYYFHAEGGASFHDEEGTVFAREVEARLEAARVLGQLINEDPMRVWQDRPFRITVTDDKGRRLFALHIATTVAPR